MRHIIAFSGGLGSFETARLVVAKHGKAAVECVFTDTTTEDEDLYRFVKDTIAFLDCKFIHIKDGRDIWDVFEDVSFQGNSRIDPCSRVLKREPFARYLDETRADPLDTTIYYGIGGHEKHRTEALTQRWAPFPVRFPLIEHGTTKEHILFYLDSLSIEPPRLYELGFEHNNCGGFCVKTGQRQMAHLLQVFPKTYAYHEQRQEQLFSRIGQHGFIRRTVDGELRYLSLKEFRELVEAGGKIQRFQDGACARF